MQDQGEGAASHRFLALGGQGRSRDCLPALESVLQLLTIGGRSKPMPARTEMLRDRTIGGEKSLGVPRRFKPLHASLALTGGLMRVLCTVIEVAVLTMLYSRHNLALGGSVALEFIGDDDPRDIG